MTDVAAGASTVPDDALQLLQGGDHDPRRRGFTLQAAELALTGAVDPYFTALANIAYSTDPITNDTNVELEEAYAQTSSLPWGLQVRAGQYLTEFGVMNPTHPHAWDWLDQPVVNSRFFGPDGMRAPGARLAWLAPLPWYSQLMLGVQDNRGEAMSSFEANPEFFEERPVGNRPYAGGSITALGDLVYSARWENSWELDRATTLKLGASAAFGPNATGPSARTEIYGVDWKLKWKPGTGERGWPFVTWQTGLMARRYAADAYFDDSDPNNIIDLQADTLDDWGFYSQILYGFDTGWAAGFRAEYASGSGESIGGRENDPWRDDRLRLSPLLVWDLSEFSRLRLQMNYDHADHLEQKDAFSLYLGLEVLFGAHPAHSY
ncbi:MAG: hypothetical protein IPJ41_03520 [Phycisphaerales bacterium]|nr:hypothetical protein [Phycisphaerales bacterium]